MTPPKQKTSVSKKVVTVKGIALVHKRWDLLYCAVTDDPQFHGTKNVVIQNVRQMLDLEKPNLKLVKCLITYEKK